MQDTIDGKEIVSESQEVVAKGLLDLTILDKTPEIHRGAMAGGRYYDIENKDMPRGSMNTEACHGKIMGLKGELKARATTKQNSSTDAPKDGSDTTADGDTNSDTEGAINVEEAPRQAPQAGTGGVQ